MVDQGNGHAYQQIARSIRSRIERGEFRPGDKIPSLHKIMEVHGVAYATAHNAVGLLASWGLVEAKQGFGTVVLPRRPVVYEQLAVVETGTYPRWRDVVAGFGMTGSQRVTGAGVAPPPADVADSFGYDAGTPVAWRSRLMLADGDAVQIVTSHFSTEVAEALPELARPELLPVSAPQLMARAGFAAVRAHRISVVLPAGEAEAEALGVEVGYGLLEVLRTDLGSDGGVLMVEREVSDTARMRVSWNARLTLD